jgi:hypothetical protein
VNDQQTYIGMFLRFFSFVHAGRDGDPVFLSCEPRVRVRRLGVRLSSSSSSSEPGEDDCRRCCSCAGRIGEVVCQCEQCG